MPEPAYTRHELNLILAHISLPPPLHSAPPSLPLLTALHTHMISTFPYENLSIHYNPQHNVSLDLHHLLQKMVLDNRGRGGYCMEIAIFYNHLLRGLGFAAYTAPAKTRLRDAHGVPGGAYPGWVHIVNIVTLSDGSRYHSDVAFGGDGPTMPLPLASGTPHRNLGAQQVRLLRDWIPEQVHKTEQSKFWIYQYRNGPDRDWNSYYCFAELEFGLADWDVVNWYTSTHKNSQQTWRVLCIRFLRRLKQKEGGHDHHDELVANDDLEQEIYGKRMLLNGTIKENLGGKTQLLAVCETEVERIGALKSHFDLTLTEEEQLAIKGQVTELKVLA